MTEFLKDNFIAPFREYSITGYVFGVVLWVLGTALVAGVLSLTIWLADSSFLPIKEKVGVVSKKYIEPAGETTTYTQVGDLMVPVTTYYDESYHVVINIDGLSDDVSVWLNNFNVLFVGDSLMCKYSNGRILNSLYIKTGRK